MNELEKIITEEIIKAYLEKETKKILEFARKIVKEKENND